MYRDKQSGLSEILVSYVIIPVFILFIIYTYMNRNEYIAFHPDIVIKVNKITGKVYMGRKYRDWEPIGSAKKINNNKTPNDSSANKPGLIEKVFGNALDKMPEKK